MNAKSTSQRAKGTFSELNEAAVTIAVPEKEPEQASSAEEDGTKQPGAPVGAVDDDTAADAAPAAIKAAASASLTDIPDDVKANMVGYDDIELNQTLLKCLGYYLHPINVDRIVLTLWSRFQKKVERTKIQRHLRELIQEGTVMKQEGTKRIYTLTDAGRAAITE